MSCVRRLQLFAGFSTTDTGFYRLVSGMHESAVTNMKCLCRITMFANFQIRKSRRFWPFSNIPQREVCVRLRRMLSVEIQASEQHVALGSP